MNYRLEDITIVIPSIIRDLDRSWIEQINNFSIAGIRVVICIPPQMDKNEAYKEGFIDKIQIINSDKKGQVRQRIYSYKFCETKLILHMDDDIFITLSQVKGLLKIYSELPEKSCLAPYLKSKENIINKKFKLISLLRNIFIFFDLNPKSGSLSISCYPVPFYFKKKEIQEVEWLPGGITLLKKLDCIKNYFRFTGKAYCEDLFHSYYLKKNKVQLFITNKFYFYTNTRSYRLFKINEFYEYFNNDFFIRNEYRKKVNKPLIPFLISYLFILFVYLGNKIIFYIKLKK